MTENKSCCEDDDLGGDGVVDDVAEKVAEERVGHCSAGDDDGECFAGSVMKTGNREQKGDSDAGGGVEELHENVETGICNPIR